MKINDDILIIFGYILSFIMILGQLIGIPTVTSIAFMLSFVIVFFIWVLHLKNDNVLDILTVAIILFSLISVIITCESLTFSYFNNWLMFVAVFLYFSVCLKIKLEEKTIRTLFRINRFLSISCVLAYILIGSNAFYVTNTGVKYLKFDFYNPNVLAIFLFCIVSTIVLYYTYYQVKFKCIREIAWIFLFVFLIYKTLSRTSLISIVFLIIISIVFARKRHYYIPNNKTFNFIVAVMPLLFAGLYMAVIDNIEQNGLLAFLVSEGKGLDSRVYVWNYAFELFKSSPIFGSYGYILTSAEFSQMHNSHINVLVLYGGIVFVLVVVFLFVLLQKMTSFTKGKANSLAIWVFILCLILGSGEAILFSGGLSFYLMVGQFLLLGNADIEEKEELIQ